MKAPPVPAVFAEPGVFCFLYKPSPWEEGAPVRTLGRMGRFWIEFVIRRGNFAACGRRVTLPPAARRRKVRLSPFPPDGENCDRSLAPPLPGEPAALGFTGSNDGLGKTPPGTAQNGHSVPIFAYPTPFVASRHLPLTGGVGPGPR